MTVKEAFDIIENDPDYVTLSKWTKKHYEAQRIFYLYYGFSKKFIRKQLKEIKKVQKGILKGVINDVCKSYKFFNG